MIHKSVGLGLYFSFQACGGACQVVGRSKGWKPESTWITRLGTAGKDGWNGQLRADNTMDHMEWITPLFLPIFRWICSSRKWTKRSNRGNPVLTHGSCRLAHCFLALCRICRTFLDILTITTWKRCSVDWICLRKQGQGKQTSSLGCSFNRDPQMRHHSCECVRLRVLHSRLCQKHDVKRCLKCIWQR